MADFQSAAQELDQRSITLIAASVDSCEDARGSIATLGLTFPVGCELDGIDVASKTGAFYSSARNYLHATAFILNPDGLVEEAVYSTGPIGRFTSTDCLALLDSKKKHG